MKTIVLFCLLVALAAASRTKHKTRASETDGPEGSDWPKPESIGDFNVPPEYGGPPPSDGDEPSPPAGNDPPPSRPNRSRRH